MSDLITLQTKLDKLTDLRNEKALQKAILDDVSGDYEALRLDILEDLQANKLRSLKNDHLTVSIKETKSVTILDPKALEAWLTENKFKPQEYMTFNKAMVDPLIKNALKQDGEVVAGTKVTITDSITVTETKEKK